MSPCPKYRMRNCPTAVDRTASQQSLVSARTQLETAQANLNNLGKPTASELLKATGLMADGPVRWGSPVRSNRPGLFVVELLAPAAPPPPIRPATAARRAARRSRRP